MRILFRLTLMAVSLLSTAPASAAAPLWFHYASQPGKPTLDGGAARGNPFATALVQLLKRPALSIRDFESGLITSTLRYSDGLQRPQLLPASRGADWPLLPPAAGETRRALVLVFSAYPSGSAFIPLQGAAFDKQRVAAAFSAAGFVTESHTDPTPEQLATLLADFARQSAAADVAALYVTGHGAEIAQTVYLFPTTQMELTLTGALRLDDFAATLRARKANLVFFAGCRDNPLRKP